MPNKYSPSASQIAQPGVRDDQRAIAEAIARSWRRCMVKGVDEQAPVADQIITAQELAQRLEKNRLLLTHAEPEMTTLSEQIAHTRSLVILTDNEGVILRTMGEGVDENEIRASLLPGASWSEEHRGTNAIGTALVERLPISVQGAEHFMAYHHSLSCSAVPIFAANNHLVATLDVSNDLNAPQQHTLALVKMAAQMVENRLFHATAEGEIGVHFHVRPEFIGTLWEGVALFDAQGRLQAINRSGQFQFGLPLDQDVLSARQVQFEDIFDEPWLAFKQRGLAAEVLFPLRLRNGARLFARASSMQAPGLARKPVRPAPRESAASLELLDSGDPQLKSAISQVKQVLNRDIPLLILGETGAGKELFSRAIHDASLRRDKPFIAVNCAALPEGLIEAELFGYEEGAYTGARRKGNIGKIQQADGGTLFLDEIGDMPLSLQARLLRVLQERSVTPLGSSRSIPVNFMLLSATNQKLKDKVAAGEFRSDLYYRINGLAVQLPALRQRQDMARLIQMILQIEQAPQAALSEEVMAVFAAHPWPGNVRQLHNVLRTAIALADGGVIERQHLTHDFLDELASAETEPQVLPVSLPGVSSLKVQSEAAIRQAMLQHGGNISAVARQLGMSRNTLYRRLQALNLS
ncbi:Transcriptional regulator of acetoin/glycerol metabolism [Methylophilus rhizosphaerae]|uniref:Transcriptional regulator of acetoin/glycerol metabolism n=1 Tax=Methylophilus rhizosphaerae TaxID=492660 RepID=A0A1G9E525_9PROT|nr:sigma-54-dependent Fis family transcriptional regulator [Methylophilus rhizosphaerae]SDK71225.1 Transcriptional regulator of acetoin/glycerol metabolism [Methylophilus rhizosphaerae]